MFYSAHRHNRLSFSSSMSKNRRQVCAKDDFMRQNIAKYENGQIPRLGYLKKKNQLVIQFIQILHNFLIE